jgi:hypothetical protein
MLCLYYYTLWSYQGRGRSTIRPFCSSHHPVLYDSVFFNLLIALCILLLESYVKYTVKVKLFLFFAFEFDAELFLKAPKHEISGRCMLAKKPRMLATRMLSIQ